MKFNKPPEFGARFQFPENMNFEYDGQTHTLVNEIVVNMAEKYDNFIVEQIAMTARSEGVSDLTVLNKQAILDAMNKQIPKKPVGMAKSELYGRCAVCGQLVHVGNRYCDQCGQAIDWGNDHENL